MNNKDPKHRIRKLKNSISKSENIALDIVIKSKKCVEEKNLIDGNLRTLIQNS